MTQSSLNFRLSALMLMSSTGLMSGCSADMSNPNYQAHQPAYKSHQFGGYNPGIFSSAKPHPSYNYYLAPSFRSPKPTLDHSDFHYNLDVTERPADMENTAAYPTDMQLFSDPNVFLPAKPSDFFQYAQYQPSAVMQASQGMPLQNRSRYRTDYAQISSHQSPAANPDVPALRGSVQPYLQAVDPYNYQPSPNSHVHQRPVLSLPAISVNQSRNAALGNSKEIAISKYRIGESEEVLEQAKAQGRIKLDLEGSIGGVQSSTVFDIIDRTDNEFNIERSAKVELSLPLYEGGRVKHTKRLAKAGVRSAIAELSQTEKRVAEKAAIGHIKVVRDRELLEISQRNLSRVQEGLRSTNLLLQNGESTIADKAIYDARLAEAQAELASARSDLKKSETEYQTVTGQRPPRLAFAPNINLPQSLAEAKNLALRHNPDMVLSRTQAEASLHNIDIAKSNSRPSLSLKGRLRGAEGQLNTIARDTAAEVLLDFRMPLYSGGENKSKLRQAVIAQSRTMLEMQNQVDELSENVETTWLELQEARDKQFLYDQQTLAARTAYDTISQQKTVGLATVLDLLAVEETLLNAQKNRIQAIASENLASVELSALIGQ